MQILLLKETDPARSIPLLIERFVTRRDLPEELRSAARLCILRLLDSSASPDLLRKLQSRYSGLELLFQWRPNIPGRDFGALAEPKDVPVDFHQLVRSVHDMKELSSLTRVVYLAWLFYIPLAEREWRSLFLSRTDQAFFRRLTLAGIVEPCNGGILLTGDVSKSALVKKFLYEKYSVARESLQRTRAERLKEERERRVRNCELDRQALELVPEGIICVDGSGLLYYMNPAAERILSQSNGLKELFFGTVSLEDALKNYSRESVLSRITDSMRHNPEGTEVFGDRIAVTVGGRRFEVELGQQVIFLRETTDQYLVDQEIGKLYRHELKAALDVMGAGIAGVKDLLDERTIEEAIVLLDQVEAKRADLFRMLEERIDFIRLHSDVFQIRPSTVNLNMVVDKCVSDYREAAAAKGVNIESNHLHSEAVFVRGEERFLVRALHNIVRNAVKFSPGNSRIGVTIGRESFEASVQVQDAGPGIPPENLGRMFQLGFTTGGTGRGLYLARRIARAHGGRIEVRSKMGHGACFTLRLPLGTES
jgi:signal transduction histidine kinase